jgi:hypothetical protein
MKYRKTKTDIRKKLMLEALEKSLGVVTSACKMSGIPRGLFYEWYNDDEEFAKEVDEVKEIVLDFAESQLHKQVSDGNTTATIFYLKTKGKSRGYVERQEIEHSGEIKEIVVNVKGLDNETGA